MKLPVILTILTMAPAAFAGQVTISCSSGNAGDDNVHAISIGTTFMDNHVSQATAMYDSAQLVCELRSTPEHSSCVGQWGSGVADGGLDIVRITFEQRVDGVVAFANAPRMRGGLVTELRCDEFNP